VRAWVLAGLLQRLGLAVVLFARSMIALACSLSRSNLAARSWADRSRLQRAWHPDLRRFSGVLAWRWSAAAIRTLLQNTDENSEGNRLTGTGQVYSGLPVLSRMSVNCRAGIRTC
jgi:hypothetical protein